MLRYVLLLLCMLLLLLLLVQPSQLGSIKRKLAVAPQLCAMECCLQY